MTTDPSAGEGGLPADLAARVEAELADGEKLVWLGQPLSARSAWMSIPLVVVGIFFASFAVLWVVLTSGGLWAARNAAGEVPGGGGFLALFGCFPCAASPSASSASA